MTVFHRFQKLYRPWNKCEIPDAEIISRYELLLPRDLVNYWKEEGWCAYASGLFWIDNPENYFQVIEAWLGENGKNTIAFGRTAFADLLLWHEGKIQYLDVLYGRIFPFTANMQLFFNTSMCDEKFMVKVFLKDIFSKIDPILKPLKIDECYAFVPALSLGGNADANNVEIVKFKEHSLFLAQVQS